MVSENRAWAEVGVLTLLSLLLPLGFHPDDPFWYNAQFCWPMLGPLLISLRYGFSKGLMSALSLFIAQMVAIKTGAIHSGGFPFKSMFGYLLLILIAGEFRDWWGKNNTQQQRQLDYAQDRLDTFTRHYHLLKASHDRLEQMVAGHALSLREAIQAVRTTISQLADRRIDEAAPSILSLFIEYGGIQTASLYKVENGQIQSTPLASVGPVHPVARDDILVQTMFTETQLVSIRSFADDEQISQYQLVVPLTDIDDNIYAVLLVEAIQFFALKKSTLTLLAVLAGHIGDLLRNTIINPVMYPDESAAFIAQVRQAQKEAKRYQIPAQLLKLQARSPSANAKRVMEHLNTTRRGLDIYLYDPDQLTLHLLMPLADELDQAGFLGRVDRWSTEVIGLSLEEIGIYLSNHIALPTEHPETIDRFIHHD
jgi:hypothetical protein